MSVSSDYYDLDQDNTLGGDNPSILKIPSQKAIKEALDTKQDVLTTGQSISISSVGEGFDFDSPEVYQTSQNVWHDVIFNNGIFVLVGTNCIATTADGETLNTVSVTGNYNSVTFGNGKYVAVGNNGYIATSSDGRTWTETRVGYTDLLEAITYPNWESVAYKDDTFLIISEGSDSLLYGFGFATAISTTGTSWSTFFTSTNNYTSFYCITAGDSGFVISGNNSSVGKYSNSSWDIRQLVGDYEFKTIYYNGSQYVMPCYAGLYTSINGTSWTFTEDYEIGSEYISSLYADNNNLLLTSYAQWLISSDLSTWDEYNFSSSIGGNETPTSFAYGNNILLTICDEGTILSVVKASGTLTISCTIDSQLSSTSENPVQNSTVTNALSDKQDTLISGTNIKTINNTSLLGSGNIDIQGGGTPTNMVTTDTTQNITGEKTFVGDKRVKFKQSTSSNKLGFTLYDNSGGEKGYLEFNPSNKIDNAPLMTLGNYATAAGNITQVGFRRYSSVSGANGAYNLLTPLIADAKSPFSLTTTYTNFYMPLGFKNGSTQVTTAKSGVADLSSLFPTIATSVSSSSTNAETVGAKLFYDTCGDIETLINAL